MIDTLNILKEKFKDFVVVGSYALYLQKLIPHFSGKDLDIVVNVSQDYLDNESDVKKLSNTRFSDYGWVLKPYDIWVEVFNDVFPEYDTIQVQGINVKVKSKRAIKEFYSTLDIYAVGGHETFTNKLLSRKQLVKAKTLC